jgi:hypothetical protein
MHFKCDQHHKYTNRIIFFAKLSPQSGKNVNFKQRLNGLFNNE